MKRFILFLLSAMTVFQIQAANEVDLGVISKGLVTKNLQNYTITSQTNRAVYAYFTVTEHTVLTIRTLLSGEEIQEIRGMSSNFYFNNDNDVKSNLVIALEAGQYKLVLKMPDMNSSYSGTYASIVFQSNSYVDTNPAITRSYHIGEITDLITTKEWHDTTVVKSKDTNAFIYFTLTESDDVDIIMHVGEVISGHSYPHSASEQAFTFKNDQSNKAYFSMFLEKGDYEIYVKLNTFQSSFYTTYADITFTSERYVPPIPDTPDTPQTPDYAAYPNDFPSEAGNYITTSIPRIEKKSVTLDTNTEIVTTQYYDGLGRLTQTVQKNSTPTKKDLVFLHGYDYYGRESEQWLPATIENNNGAYADPDIIQTNSFDQNDDNIPYARGVYEKSPLNRMEKQFGPGQDWQTSGGHPVRTDYRTNNTTYPCRYYSISGDNLVKNASDYANNILYVTQITDEDNKISYEFRDKLDRVILQRQMDGATKHDTYYVYDDFNNLCFVLPPMASDSLAATSTYIPTSNSALKNYAYIYKYDNHNRCKEKKLPGADPVYYVYDKADRLIFSQDGVQRPTNDWTFYKYDALGRIIVSGVWKNSGKLQSNLVTLVQSVVVVETDSVNGEMGYTKRYLKDIPNGSTLLANYYDNYKFKSLQAFRDADTNIHYYAYSTPPGFNNKRYGTDGDSIKSKGLLTGTITAMLDNPTLQFFSVFYYDGQGRMVQSISANHLGGFEKEYINYSFTSQPIRKQMIHSASGKSITETYTYGYDHVDRPTTTTYQLDSNTPVTLSTLAYDDKGRVSSKTLSGSTLPVTYSYNIRNWLRTIGSSHFNETLYYTENNEPLYNGNISTIEWTTSPHPTMQRYVFTYDDLNRLTLANYYSTLLTDLNKPYRVRTDYDKMGNITHLKRYNCKEYAPDALIPANAIMDDLSMSYVGNQLSKVVETGNLSEGFIKPSGIVANEYTYNKNGALTSDYNRGIFGIQYNILHLPDKITFSASHSTQYSYDASGVKRRVIHVTVENKVAVKLPAGSSILGTTSVATGGTTNTFSTASSSTISTTSPAFTTSPASIGSIQAINQTQMKDTTDYCGHIVYENGALKYILNQEGYVTKNGSSYVFNYYMRDHLGNNRIVVAINGNSHQAVQATDYDPFGMPFSNGVNPERQPYKFGGKEYDEMHGLNWYDFGARAYDGILGRFPTTMDPLAEKYYSVSPYAYCLNNPVRFVDPTGEDYWSTNDPDQIRAFINALGSGATQFDFSSGWNHMTDGEFADRLSYNDETQKFYISYGTVENGEVVIVGRSFDANITPVSSSGEGYPGAFIYKPRTGFPGLIERLDSSLNPYSSPHNSYDDGTNTWSVNSSGRITGIAPPTPIMGYPPMVGKGKISTKGMPHGDAGRALSQAERRIAELEKQLQTATGKDKKAIQQTIKNIRETAQKKAKGETHWRK